jgi:Response regulators consisting of a CheY-like receiver domain and a winged-helix DNA-binding domain
MKSKRDLLHELTDQNLSANQRAQARCQLAIQLETEGEYDGAREAMGELWQRLGERPLVEGLDEETKGAVLLRAGVLTGWLGSAKQINGAQETAKDLITESIEIFEALQERSRAAEGLIELACCYWREGKFDEGRVLLNQALHRLRDGDIELRAKALLRSAIIEKDSKRYSDALRIHTEAAPLLQQLQNHCLIGSCHNDFAIVLRNLGSAENREDYIDRALIEYAAAAYHFEQASHLRYQACVENNLAVLFWNLQRFADAHKHLDRAQILFARLKDDLHGAQVDETRARVLLAQGRVIEAEKAARRAVRTFETGDAAYLLAEALTTHATASARLHHSIEARATFERAINVAEQAGDNHGAGLAALALVEELGSDLTHDELSIVIDRAASFLAESRDLATVRRLAIDACNVVSVIRNYLEFPPTVDWTKFSFTDAVRRYEAHFIKLALKDAGGRITRAARLLGFKRHQSLTSLLKRHKDIPVTRRKRSIIRAGDTGTRTVRILHVEDDETVAAMVQEMLEIQGWQVETCADGNAGLERISSEEADYDLLLVDYDLDGVNGLELVHRARKLAHRSHLPIIVLSATPVGPEAREAGADVFLHKPQDIGSLIETITRLLREREQAG